MSKIIAIANQKGGVGKSTTTLNLAYSLEKLGKKVLAVDLDSQANLTTCFGINNPNAIETNIAHLMMKGMGEEALPEKKNYIITVDGVDLIPASIYLSVVDASLRLEMGSETILADILEPLKVFYDYIIIDTTPSLGSLTINALSAADSVVITVNPQLLAMMGLNDLMTTIVKIKRRINPNLSVEGILLTMCETRTNLYKLLSNQLSESYQDRVRIFETQIPASVKVGEANYYGMSIQKYDSTAKAGQAYLEFAKELIA